LAESKLRYAVVDIDRAEPSLALSNTIDREDRGFAVETSLSEDSEFDLKSPFEEDKDLDYPLYQEERVLE